MWMHLLWEKIKRNSSFEVLSTLQLLELVSLSTQYLVFPFGFSWQFGMGLSKQYGNVKQCWEIIYGMGGITTQRLKSIGWIVMQNKKIVGLNLVDLENTLNALLCKWVIKALKPDVSNLKTFLRCTNPMRWTNPIHPNIRSEYLMFIGSWSKVTYHLLDLWFGVKHLQLGRWWVRLSTLNLLLLLKLYIV